MSFYRIQSAARDTADLLVAEHQTSMHYSTGEAQVGVSVCDSREELAEYIAQSGVEWDGSWVLVEVDGYTAEDRDLDADAPGRPRLIHPTEVVSAEPLTDGFEDEIFAAYDALYA